MDVLKAKTTRCPETSSEASIEPEYLEANVSVWWDINNCPPVEKIPVSSIAENIKSALRKLGYRGHISISANGDTSVVPFSGLSYSGIFFTHVNRGLNDDNIPELLLGLLSWALDNPAPATILLICGESVFSNALSRLRSKRYDILLAAPSKVYPPAAAETAKAVWFWAGLLAGGPPVTIGSGGEAPTEADYLAAKTSVWWHMENCPVPGGYNDVKVIPEHIKSALANLNYSGPVSIFAYGGADPDSIPESCNEISLTYVPSSSKNSSKSEKKMLSDMMIWALDNPAPANVFLISGDSVFSAALHHLVKSGYSVFLAQQRGPSCATTLAAAAKTEWCWNDLLAGGSPLDPTDRPQCVEVPVPMKKYTLSGDVTGGHLTAMTSVWWDLEYCGVPREHDTKSLARNIKSALCNLGYSGPVSIFAYGYTDALIPDYVRSDFASTGISLNPIASGEEERTMGSKYSTYMKMMVDMSGWALENAAPANIVLISWNLDFHSTLKAFHNKGFNILLGTCVTKSIAPYLDFAQAVWPYLDLLAGDPPADRSYLTSQQRSSADENGFTGSSS